MPHFGVIKQDTAHDNNAGAQVRRPTRTSGRSRGANRSYLEPEVKLSSDMTRRCCCCCCWQNVSGSCAIAKILAQAAILKMTVSLRIC